MTRQAVRFSPQAKGCIYVPDDGKPTTGLFEIDLEAVRERLSQLTGLEQSPEVAELYGDEIAADEQIADDLKALLVAKNHFQQQASAEPYRRVPMGLVMKYGGKLACLLFRIDPSGVTTSRIAQIEVMSPDPSYCGTAWDRAVDFRCGIRPLAGAEPALQSVQGVTSFARPLGSVLARTFPVDCLAFQRDQSVEGESILYASRRHSAVVAMGDMVEPLLDANGLGDLYMSWSMSQSRS